MFRFNLIPKDVRFFDLFEQAGQNLQEISRAMVSLLDDYSDLDRKLAHLKELEHIGDTYTQTVMRALNKTFLTPLDREDITDLVHAMDDVADKAWAAATRLDIYQIPAPTPTAQALAHVLVGMVDLLAGALPHLRHRGRMQLIIPVAEQVGRLESEADEHLRSGLRSLFSDPNNSADVVLSIKWREIYELLEEATDRAEDVADVLEAIVLKHG